ncbi:MAG: 4Fe-4S binding protein [Thermodesulfobacteriota bacterium]
MRPKVEAELCAACGTCVERCPISALSIIDGLPTVKPERCIACLCCHEIGPETAIRLT